jgi:hypothetical protein
LKDAHISRSEIKSLYQKTKLGICAVMKCMLVERFAICLIHVKCVSILRHHIMLRDG